MTDIPTLHFDGKLFRLPFSNLFRLHTPAERERLTTSIAEHGIQVRIITYDSPTYGPRCVIDGATRLEIAIERQMSAVSIHHRGADLDDEAAEELARSLNRDRRHLTLEEQQLERRERVKRVVAQRAAGKSLRAISEEEGVSHTQVVRDLEETDPGVTPVTPEDDSEGTPGVTPVTPEAPDVVVGTDGKRYPARRPSCVSPDSDTESVPAMPSEGMGVAAEAVLGTAQEALATLRQSLEQLESVRAEAIARCLGRHGNPHLNLAALDAALSDLAAEIIGH